MRQILRRHTRGRRIYIVISLPKQTSLHTLRVNLLLAAATFARHYQKPFVPSTIARSFMSDAFWQFVVCSCDCTYNTALGIFSQNDFRGRPNAIVKSIYQGSGYESKCKNLSDFQCEQMLGYFHHTSLLGTTTRSHVVARIDVIQDAGLGLMAMKRFTDPNEMICIYGKAEDVIFQISEKSDGILEVSKTGGCVDGRRTAGN